MSRPTSFALSVLILLPALALLVGCAAPKSGNWSPEEHSVPILTMRLEPGDTVEVNLLGAPELNMTQTIRRDGMIALQLLGDVKAAGKTPGTLQEELSNLYAKQLQIKEATLIVRTPTIVFVTGSVLEPGKYEMVRPLTALEAVMEAGGFDRKSAEVRSVVVIRHEQGKREGFLIDCKSALAGDRCNPFYLRPFDIVYVPRTAVSKANQVVDQYINKMIPRLGFTVSSSGEVYYRF